MWVWNPAPLCLQLLGCGFAQSLLDTSGVGGISGFLNKERSILFCGPPLGVHALRERASTFISALPPAKTLGRQRGTSSCLTCDFCTGTGCQEAGPKDE